MTRRSLSLAAVFLLLISSSVVAQVSSSSAAFGESVNLTVTQTGGSTFTVQSGPLPTVSGIAPPIADVANSAGGVSVANDVLGTVLQTGRLTVRATSNVPTSNAVSAEATVDSAVFTLGDLLSLSANQVASTSSVGGTCGSALTVTGASAIRNGFSTGSAGSGAIPPNPAPNFVFANSSGIRVVLNEQIPSGDAVSERTLTVNGVHIFFSSVNVPGAGIVNGEIILAQSRATLRCSAAAGGADLSIDKSASPNSPNVGQTLTYTLRIQNRGPDTAAGVAVSDNLPSQLSVASVTSTQGTCTSTTASVNCNLGSISSGSSATVTIVANANAAGSAVNTASVSSSTADSNTANNTDSVTNTIDAPPAPIISVRKTATAITVNRGQPLQYTVTVRNSGNAPSESLTMTDVISSSATLASVTTNVGTCTNTSPVTCSLGVLAPGASATVTIVVTPNVAGTLSNTAVVGDLSSTVSTVVTLEGEPELSISKTASPLSVRIGQPLTYTIAVTNNGAVPVNGITVSDAIASTATLTSSSSTQGSCSSTTPVSCTVGTLASGATATITIVVVPNSAGVLVNTARVGSRSSTVATNVTSGEPTPPVSITKTASPESVRTGELLTYTITVRNNGTTPAANVVLSDVIATSVSLGSISTSQGTCSAVSPVICNLGTLAPGASATVTVRVTPNAAGALTNTAAVGDQRATVITNIASSQPAAKEIVFPIASRTAGARGSFWRTDLRIANQGSAPANITLEWYPFNSAGTTGPERTRQVVVEPGRVAVLDEVLQTLLGVTGNGSLRLLSDSTSVAASLRIYNRQQDGCLTGTFGASFNGQELSDFKPSGVLLLLSNESAEEGIRTNIGYFNDSNQPSQVTFSVYTAEGGLLGTKTLDLPPFANAQRNIFDLIDTVDVSARQQRDFYVYYQAEGGRPFIYASAVYNSSNDGLIILPESTSVPISGGREIVFPIASRTAGARGSFWRTDLRIVNNGLTPATISVQWFPFDSAGRSAAERTRQITVEAGRVAVLDEVLQTLLGVSGNGSLRLVSDSQSIEASLRIYNRQQDGCLTGTFGSAFNGQELSDIERRGVLLLLSNEVGNDAGIRTNIGYFNNSTQSATVTFRVFTADGRLLGTKTLNLPPFANAQRNIFDLVDTVAPGDRQQRDLYVHFESTGGAPFIYASAVYNSSNDGLIILPASF